MIHGQPSPELRELGYSISNFYLAKHGENYELAAQDAEKLKITNLTLENSILTIYTPRPGLLIGGRGENIGNLSDWLKEKNQIVKVEIIESFHWDDILIPYDWMGELEAEQEREYHYWEQKVLDDAAK